MKAGTMMRRAIIATCAALLCGCATPPRITFDAQNKTVTNDMLPLALHVGGRVVAQPLASGATGYTHEWPGTYFEAAFAGRAVVAKFDDDWNEYRLLIDDLPPIAVKQSGKVELSVGGLAPGRHRLRLEEVTESYAVPRQFQGFYVTHREKPLPPPPPRARQIEFIGDSSMTGYGVHATKQECSYEEVRLMSDTQIAYPALVAKHFDADYQINAESGRGLVRNYDGADPDRPMSKLYSYALSDKSVVYSDPTWRPQIIFFRLVADFVKPLKPDEKWKTNLELGMDYFGTLRVMLRELHKQSPSATVLVKWYDMSKVTDPNTVQQHEEMRQAFIAAAREAGIARIEFPQMPDLGYEGTACYHPTARDHEKMAAWLIAWLEARPDLWQGR
jgi:hypothetical protein